MLSHLIWSPLLILCLMASHMMSNAMLFEFVMGVCLLLWVDCSKVLSVCLSLHKHPVTGRLCHLEHPHNVLLTVQQRNRAQQSNMHTQLQWHHFTSLLLFFLFFFYLLFSFLPCPAFVNGLLFLETLSCSNKSVWCCPSLWQANYHE